MTKLTVAFRYFAKVSKALPFADTYGYSVGRDM